MAQREQLEQAIEAQEKLRGAIPDDVVDAAISALHEQLAGLEQSEERRRQVTVLFADVSGFTTLSDHRDPEVITELMNALWTRLDAHIVEGGGTIDKHIGDAVMAVWGIHGSREDDPERAVRTALTLQGALSEFRSTSGDKLTMRVGVNTGPAHLATVVTTGEFTAIGDTVNIASRLESAAPLGGVLISHFTYRHVRGLFDVEPRVPLQVKGKRDLLRTYVVLQPKRQSFRIVTRGVEGIETEMVGRDVEFAELCGHFEAVVLRGVSRLVTVFGDAGVGKSRLLYELENWLELRPEGVYFFKGRALSNRESLPYGLFRDLVAARFGILDSDTPEIVANKLRAGMATAIEPDEADLVGHWLGFDLSTTAAVQRMAGAAEFATVARAHFVEYVRSLAASEPVAILLEDLHWADEESLDLIAHLAASLVDVPVIIVGAARPTLLERRPSWALNATRIVLDALSEVATRALVGEVLQQVPDIPERLVRLVVQRSDGNAFYVEELISMLIDEGVIETDPDHGAWHVDLSSLDPVRVPPTLTAVLQARLDLLARSELQTLQDASVVGRVFWDTAVAALGAVSTTPAPTPDVALAALQAVTDREFVFRRAQSSFDDTTEYIFKHALLRDVTYETVLLREREQLHREVAQWLERSSRDRRSEYLEMIAEHYERANEVAKAGEYLAASATAAYEKGNPAAVQRFLERALALPTDSVGNTLSDRMLVRLGEARCRLGELDAAEEVLTEVVEHGSDPGASADAFYWLSRVAELRADPSRVRAALEQALELAGDGENGALALILAGLAHWEAQYGDLHSARELGERALALAEGKDIDAAEAHRALAFIAILTHDLDTAEQHAQASADLAARAGNLEIQALSLGNRGMLAHLRGDADGRAEHYQAAAADYTTAVALARRLGLASTESVNALNLAQVSVRLGDQGAARRHLRESVAAAIKAGAVDQLLFCLLVEADRVASCGDIPTALGLIELARNNPAAGTAFAQEADRILSRIPAAHTAREAAIPVLDFDAAIEAILADR